MREVVSVADGAVVDPLDELDAQLARLRNVADELRGARGRPVLEGLCDLNDRIYKEFRFRSGVTTISTPVSQVMTTPRMNHTATLLDNGTVLIAGGVDASGTALDTTEIFTPNASGTSGSLHHCPLRLRARS